MDYSGTGNNEFERNIYEEEMFDTEKVYKEGDSDKTEGA